MNQQEQLISLNRRFKYCAVNLMGDWYVRFLTHYVTTLSSLLACYHAKLDIIVILFEGDVKDYNEL